MEFKRWMVSEEQSQDTLFMQTDKTGLGPKPSTNSGLPKPSDGWLRGKGQPTFFMKKKMKREWHEEVHFDAYEKVAKEMVHLLDTRPGGLAAGLGHDRASTEQESLKLLNRYFPDEQVDWSRLEELAKNFVQRAYRNYSQDMIRTEEGKIDSLLSYLPKYFHAQ